MKVAAERGAVSPWCAVLCAAVLLGISIGHQASAEQSKAQRTQVSVQVSSAEVLVGSPARGKAIFRFCAPCHDVGRRAKHKWGPQLNALIGSPVGAREGYPSSFLMIYFGMSGEVWTEQLLSQYIEGPGEFLTPKYNLEKSSTSPFVGLKDPQARADLIAYIAASGETR